MKKSFAALWIIGGVVVLIGSGLFLFSESMSSKNDEPKPGPDEDEIKCFQCRATIPREAEKCPQCGWKWTKQE
jgi:hypothetical protein